MDILVVTESKLDESFPAGQFCMQGYCPPFRLDRNANGGGVPIYVRDDIILVVTESKLDDSFPKGQFLIEGYSPPFRLDRNANGGGILIYVRSDITCKELKDHTPVENLEGIFLELNLKKSKWLLFGGYNPNKDYIVHFTQGLGAILDHYMSKYDNFILLGDFNSEMGDNTMAAFGDTYNLTNLIKEPTCFKNPLNPSSIDLILTNRSRSFQNSQTLETRLSDHHKLTITVIRAFFPKY